MTLIIISCFQNREQNRMARSYVGTNKSNASNESPKEIKKNYNLMTSSMPSLALSKALYSNTSSYSKAREGSVRYTNQSPRNTRFRNMKDRPNMSERVKSAQKQIHDTQVRL